MAKNKTNSEPIEPAAVPRQIGRVDDETWHTLKTAAQRSGRSFTEWAVGILLDAARNNHKGFDLKEPNG